ncbi:MAG TPA: type II 3-dehydroquinate dehydratase [Candidatus Dormibacteraeota bacterium]|nr:type II 3-dehydroquinate dehydratase [Candidatus Dormibacteraeota bacterium]
MRVQVLHGPNLNLLGTREPTIYGTTSLAEIDQRLVTRGAELGLEVRCAQSNSEGEMVDLIQAAGSWAEALIINPAAYSHTSVAIRDAIAAVGIRAVEVHLSNPQAREEFRHVDLVAGVCWALVAGFGADGYFVALERVAAVSRPPSE